MSKTYVCLVISIFVTIISLTNVLTEKFDEFIDRRCNETLPKDKSDQCLECYKQIPKLLRDPISKCALEVCNKDGKFKFADICCFFYDDKKMDDCYQNKTAEEVKASGLTFEDANNKTASYINDYEKCLTKVFP